MQLEVAQVDEFATVAPCNIARPFEFIRNRCRFRHQFPAVRPRNHCSLLIRHCHSSLQPLQHLFASRMCPRFAPRFLGR